MDKDVGLICMLNLFLIFKNVDIDVEVKGWIWMLFTSFTSRRTRHKNKDVVHLVLTEELTSKTQTDSSVSQDANDNIAQYWIVNYLEALKILFKKLFVVMLLLLKVVVTPVDAPVVDDNHRSIYRSDDHHQQEEHQNEKLLEGDLHCFESNGYISCSAARELFVGMVTRVCRLSSHVAKRLDMFPISPTLWDIVLVIYPFGMALGF
ncbi:hypothetical protein Tco_0769450 [Tanacetum coccineum]|uniref:Uncharacterized protein n=1 Tax=Tanacetum coccineum TaxID=301880 RepID=A0ABQ4Z9F5_9ASTR